MADYRSLWRTKVAELSKETFLAKSAQFKHIPVWFEAYLWANFRGLAAR